MVFNPLKRGDLIGIIATSSPAKQERFEAGCRALQGQGFTLKIAGDPCGAYGSDTFLFASAPATERAANLMQLYRDPAVKAVIAARGAGGAVEVLPLLDTHVFRDNPKPFIGFSDSTAVLLTLENLGCPVIHGPHIESFAAAATEPDVAASAAALAALLVGRIFSTEPAADSVAEYAAEYLVRPLAHPRSVSGQLLGGNLSVIAALCGTPWQPRAAGKVLFIEEINEKPYRVHRMLVQLRQSGVLDGVLGVCLGAFTKCEADVGASLKAVIIDALGPLGIPVYEGLPAGHVRANNALPFFGTVQIREDKLTVYLK